MIDLPYMCRTEYPATGTRVEIFWYVKRKWAYGKVAEVDLTDQTILAVLPGKLGYIYVWSDEWRLW